MYQLKGRQTSPKILTPIFRVQVSFCAFREGIEKINSIFAVCRVNWADW